MEALERIDEGTFDLIVSDWMMPRLDGIELCKTLRERESTREIPVVMVSTRNSPDDIAKALDAGVVEYVTKPYSRDNLKTRISSALSR